MEIIATTQSYALQFTAKPIHDGNAVNSRAIAQFTPDRAIHDGNAVRRGNLKKGATLTENFIFAYDYEKALDERSSACYYLVIRNAKEYIWTKLSK